jgi:carbon-monoxide dehydrogenase medium subunit
VLDVKDGTIQSARVGLTGATTHAMRLTAVEQALAGKKADAVAEAVKSAAAGVADVNGDLHASVEYRQAMIPVFVRRAVEKALSRA